MSLIFASPLLILDRVDGLEDLAELLSSDSDLACVVPDALLGALEHVAVEAEVFRVDLNYDIGGTEDTPRIIDTTSIVFDCSELVLIEGAIHVDGAVFALDEARLLL